MKPFDLETYKKDPSREIVTRDGRKARIICTDRVIDNYQIVALIQFRDREIIQSYTELGHASHGHTDTLDLFFAPIKRKGWINIYKEKNEDYSFGRIYKTKEDAKLGQPANSEIATIMIEWEE